MNKQLAPTDDRFSVAKFHDSTPVYVAPRAEALTIKTVEKQMNKQSFEEICALFDEHIANLINKNSDLPEGLELFDLEKSAVLGKKEEVTTVMEKIDSFLQNEGILHCELPEYYIDLDKFAPDEQQRFSNLTHAVFHELYGLSVLASWLKHPGSYAAQIIGTKLWYFIPEQGKHVMMPYQFKKREDFDRIVRNFSKHKDTAKVNEYNPSLEVALYTGERVSILIEPDVIQPVITLRRFIIGHVTLEDLAERGTIPKEAVPLFRAISKTHCNCVVVGPPGAGKSNFLKAMVGERKAHYTGVSIENLYELGLSVHFPDKKLIEIITDDFNLAMQRLLRQDADYGIVGEVRWVEVLGAVDLCERLSKGMLTTFHMWKPVNLPFIWARILCNLMVSNMEMEMKRVADAIDLIIVLSDDGSKIQKRVRGVYELRHDPKTGEISSNAIMLFDRKTKEWSYRANVTEQLLEEMDYFDSEYTTLFESLLSELAEEKPMPESKAVEIYNPITRNPQHMLVEEMKKLNHRLEQKGW